jgi:hypothetical protein
MSEADCFSAGPCTVTTCDTSAGVCVTSPGPDGPIPGKDDLVTDCIDVMCSGGMEVIVADDTEVPEDNDPCTSQICSGGAALTTLMAPGTPCDAAMVCDAAAQCVPCYADGLTNGAESDVDCGGVGPGCVPCPDGQKCSIPEDCASAECCVACLNACVPPGSCIPC